MRTLCGKRILLTGATGTLGAAAARQFLAQGAELILPVRNPQKAEQLRSVLLKLHPRAALSFPLLDLADTASVRALTRQLIAEGRPLDGLVHNAGIFTRAGRTAPGGREIHMQVNCNSPLMLTGSLLPLLTMAEEPFVLTVTSLSAFWKNEDVSPTDGTWLYAASKRSLLLQLLSIAEEMPKVDLLFAHPGVCATGLFLSDPRQSAYSPAFLRLALPLMKLVFPSPEKACRSILHAAQHAQNGQLAEPGGLLHIWGKPALVPLSHRLKNSLER